KVAIRHQIQQRSEGFMLHDFKIRLRRSETWFHVTTALEILALKSFAAAKNIAPFIFQSLNGLLDSVNSGLVDHRSHHSFSIERISDLQTLVCGQQFFANRRRDRFLYDDAPG